MAFNNKNIRMYKEEDNSEMLRILNEKGGHSYVGSNLDLGEYNKILVYDDGQIKGFSCMEVHPKIAQVILYTSPLHRRKGIGSALWEQSLKELQELDPNTIWIFFRNDIGEAAEFYRKRGVNPWYSYHRMEYKGEKFEKVNLRRVKYSDDLFEMYLKERSDAFYDINVRVGIEPPAESERRNEVSKWVAESKENLYVYFYGEKIIGSLAIIDDCFIDELFVCKDCHGKGYGKAIVKDSINYILENHKTPALCVVTKNEPAVNLYKSVGFEIVKTLEMNRIFSKNKEPDLRGPM